MGLLRKIEGAVTYWVDRDARRSDVLSATAAWSVGLITIGVVFVALCATGTFPAPVDVMVQQHTFIVTIVKYVLYILGGCLALLGVMLARGALAAGHHPSGAQLLLGCSAATVLASAGMTIATLVRTASSHHHQAAAYIYVVDAVVLLVRLLFVSILVMAMYTLHEAAGDAVIADIVLSGTVVLPVTGPSPLPGAGAKHVHTHALPVSYAAAATAPATHQPGVVIGQPAVLSAPPAAAMSCPSTGFATSAHPTAYPAQTAASPTQGSPWGTVDALAGYTSFRQAARQQRCMERRQMRGL